jgi:hypothetical protein
LNSIFKDSNPLDEPREPIFLGSYERSFFLLFPLPPLMFEVMINDVLISTSEITLLPPPPIFPMPSSSSESD